MAKLVRIICECPAAAGLHRALKFGLERLKLQNTTHPGHGAVLLSDQQFLPAGPTMTAPLGSNLQNYRHTTPMGRLPRLEGRPRRCRLTKKNETHPRPPALLRFGQSRAAGACSSTGPINFPLSTR